MRIALVSHEIPGNSASGVGSYTLHCAAALARGGAHEPHIFTFVPTKETHRLIPPGVHLHCVAGLGEGVANGQISGQSGAHLASSGLAGQYLAQSELLCESVRECHKTLPFDIIEAPEVCFPALPLLIRPIPDVPVVTMLHAGTAISRHFNDVPLSKDDRLMMALEFAAIALADGLCAPTRAVVEATRRFIPFTQDAEVFPSPVPSAQCLAAPVQAASSSSESYVMFAGRIERLKGCCELALAANAFLKACPDAELRLYGPDRPLPLAPAGPQFKHNGGDPWNGGSTRQWMCAHLDAEVFPRVRFMGTASPAEMGEAYAGCRFVVVPSRFENFGTTAAEAIVAGRPVIYSAGTGLEETAGDAGLAARLEDPGHLAAQMTLLWKDANLRRSLVSRGAERLGKQLSVDAAVARRLEFYRKIIAQRPLDAGEKMHRLAAVPAESLFAVLRTMSDMVGRLAGISSAESLSPGIRAARALEKLRQAGKPASFIWLYGGGQHTRRLLVERHVIQKSGARICGIIDDAALPGDTLYDLPVLSRTGAENQLRDRLLTIDTLLLSSDSIEEKLWNNAEGFRRQHIPVVRLYS